MSASIALVLKQGSTEPQGFGEAVAGVRLRSEKVFAKRHTVVVNDYLCVEWCIPPPYSFNAVFDEYNFSIISNLFDNNHLYALSTHKSKMCEQNVSYLLKDLELEAKKLNRICHKNCSKSSKMAITVSKF